MRLRFLSAALTVCALLAPMQGTAHAQPADPPPRPQAGTAEQPAPIDWTECGTTHKGECATIKVPLDYAAPEGPAIDLAIGRLKALDPANRLGVLIAHPGGPGQPGIDTYITRRGIITDDSPLRRYFDIVSVDPRGVGRSTKILCSEETVVQAPLTYPRDEAEYRAWLAYNDKLSQDCRRHTGALFDHADTTNVARDVDSIRKALGERKISFFAISYGTQVGQQYAELFPGNIRAMALDSNMDHSVTSAYEYLRTTTEDLEGSFHAFVRWCADTAACPLHGENVTRLWDDLLAKAEAGDLKDPGTGRPITGEDLRFELFNAMYRPSAAWFPLASSLKALATGQPATSSAARADESEPVNYAYPAIWCSDWRWNVQSFAQLDRYRKRLESVAPHTKLSPFWSDVLTCLGWKGETSNPQHRLRIHGTPPILVATARHDVGTPVAWNESAARQIPRSVVLRYDGVGHGQFRNSTCARDHITTYLITLRTPAPGTRCPAEYPAEPPVTANSTPDTPRAATGRPVH